MSGMLILAATPKEQAHVEFFSRSNIQHIKRLEAFSFLENILETSFELLTF